MTVEINILEIQEALEKERQVLQESIDSGDGAENLPINPDHGDLARIYDARQRNTYLESIVEEKLEQIEAAFKRLEDGTYGKCLRCGKDIHPERLKAIPYAELCVNCQSKARH